MPSWVAAVPPPARDEKVAPGDSVPAVAAVPVRLIRRVGAADDGAADGGADPEEAATTAGVVDAGGAALFTSGFGESTTGACVGAGRLVSGFDSDGFAVAGAFIARSCAA